MERKEKQNLSGTEKPNEHLTCKYIEIKDFLNECQNTFTKSEFDVLKKEVNKKILKSAQRSSPNQEIFFEYIEYLGEYFEAHGNTVGCFNFIEYLDNQIFEIEELLQEVKNNNCKHDVFSKLNRFNQKFFNYMKRFQRNVYDLLDTDEMVLANYTRRINRHLHPIRYVGCLQGAKIPKNVPV